MANDELCRLIGDCSGANTALLQGASEKQIVYTALDNMMTHSYKVITDIAKESGICMRMAAYKHSVENIYRTEEVCGNMF